MKMEYVFVSLILSFVRSLSVHQPLQIVNIIFQITPNGLAQRAKLLLGKVFCSYVILQQSEFIRYKHMSIYVSLMLIVYQNDCTKMPVRDHIYFSIDPLTSPLSLAVHFLQLVCVRRSRIHGLFHYCYILHVHLYTNSSAHRYVCVCKYRDRHHFCCHLRN